MTTDLTTSLPEHDTLLDVRTAEGALRDGSPVLTTVDATLFEDFTATTLRQGRTSATAYNAPNGRGTHVGLSVHEVLSYDVVDSSYGPRINIMTTEGLVQVDLFGVRTDEGTHAPVTFGGVTVASY